MSAPSIYDDLARTESGEKVNKLKEQNEKLLNHIKILEGDIEKLCGELTKMKRREDNLKKNISELYNTSKVEIERKDRMIAELRKQLDDLLFRRHNVYPNSKQHLEQCRYLDFNKRRRDEVASEYDSSANKKQKVQSANDFSRKDVKPQSVLPLKTEYAQETISRSESNRTCSNSPSRRSRSRSRYRCRSRKRSCSRSKIKNRYRSRERGQLYSKNMKRGRSCNRSRERSQSYHKTKEPNRSRNSSDKNNILYAKDLREVLSSCSKSKEGAAFKKSGASDNNDNFVINNTLNSNLNKYNGHMTYENNVNSKNVSDRKNFNDTRSKRDVNESTNTVENSDKKIEKNPDLICANTNNETVGKNPNIKDEIMFQSKSEAHNKSEKIIYSKINSVDNQRLRKIEHEFNEYNCCKINDFSAIKHEKISCSESQMLQNKNTVDENRESSNIISPTAAFKSTNTTNNSLVLHDRGFVKTKLDTVNSSANTAINNVEETVNIPRNETFVEVAAHDIEITSSVRRHLQNRQDQTDETVCNISGKATAHRRRRCTVINIVN